MVGLGVLAGASVAAAPSEDQDQGPTRGPALSETLIQQRRIIAAAADLLNHLEHDGWLPVQEGWTAADRRAYITIVRSFVNNPQLEPSSDSDAYMSSKPLQPGYFFFHAAKIKYLDSFDVQMVIAHELFHNMPRQIAFTAAHVVALQAVSGGSLEDPARRDMFRHAVGLHTTQEAEAWAFEIRIAHQQAASQRVNFETFLAQRIKETADSGFKVLLKNFSTSDRRDPTFQNAESRATLIVSGLAVSVPVAKNLKSLYEWEVAHGNPFINYQGWLESWIANPSYAELRPEERSAVMPAIAAAAVGVGSVGRRGFFAGALGTPSLSASPLHWLGRLFGGGQPLSLRARISKDALTYRADQPPPKRKKSVDYTNIEDDFDAGHFGGLGTGSIGFNLFGQLTSIRLSGNPSNQIYPEGQVAIYESNGKETWATPLGKHPDPAHLKDKRLSQWSWAKAEQMANSALVRILHPFTQWEYGRPLGQAGQVTVRRFSPMVPGNVGASNLPIQVTEVEIKNTGREPREFSVLVSMPNLAGWDSKVDDPHYQLLPTNENQYSSVVTNRNHLGVVMRADQAKDPRFVGRTALFTEKAAGLSVTAIPAFDVNGAGAEEAWDAFAKNGLLPAQASQPALSETRAIQNGKELAGAVAVKFTLEPGESRVVPFSYSFDFPNDVRNERTFEKNYVPAANRPAFAQQVAELAIDKHRAWAADIDHWQAKILKDHRISDHEKALLISEIYFLLAGGGLFTKDGTLYLMEGWDPRLLATSDVWFYTPMLAELFPELEKGLMRAMAAEVLAEDKTVIQYHGPYVTGNTATTRDVYGGDEAFNQKEVERLKGGIEVPGKYPGIAKKKGVTPHHMDSAVLGPISEKVDNPVGRHINRYLRNHNTWKDLSPKFVLMVWRVFVIDGKKDRQFLQSTWAALAATLEHQRSFIDDSGLPVHQGYPDWTYDTWPVKGYSTYTAVLTLEALQAAIAIGKELGKTDAELKIYGDWLTLGRANLQNYLWNESGQYFYISAEKSADGHVTPKDDVMADALMGTLYAKLYGLEGNTPIVSDAQIRAHLKKVYRNNFELFHNGTVGVVNGTTWDAKPLSTVGGDVQAGEVWLGTQRAVAALMIRVGLHKEADKLLAVDLATVSNGFQSRTPEAVSVGKDGDIRFRFSTYMRAGAIWLVYEALRPFTEHGRQLLSRRFLPAILLPSTRSVVGTAA